MQNRRQNIKSISSKIGSFQVSLAFVLAGFACDGFGQMKMNARSHSGIELQQFSTGFLFGLYHGAPITDHLFRDIRLGYNLVRHGDAGVQSDERGGGFGGSAGLYWTTGLLSRWPRKAWVFGVRTDLWFNKIDWIHRSPNCIDFCDTMGNTDVTVLQLTAVIGYQIPLNDHWQLTPTLALVRKSTLMWMGPRLDKERSFLGSKVHSPLVESLQINLTS